MTPATAPIPRRAVIMTFPGPSGVIMTFPACKRHDHGMRSAEGV